MNNLNNIKSLWRCINIYNKIDEDDLNDIFMKMNEASNLINQDCNRLEYLLMDIFNYQLKIFNDKAYFIDDDLNVTVIDWKYLEQYKDENIININSRKINYIRLQFIGSYSDIEADIAIWNKYIISMLHLLEIHEIDGKEISEDTIKSELIDLVNFEN